MRGKKLTVKRREGIAMLGVFAVVASLLYILYLPSVASLVKRNPSTTSLIAARRAEGVAVRPLRWTPFSEISASMKSAVVVSEDASFWSHSGIDYHELLNAARDLVTRYRIRGASTITQQVAKNLYLSESRNPLRKIKEILIARSLEETLRKERILEIYLNVVEFGEGIFGIGQASAHYFGIKPSQLTISQAAFLTAVLPGPRGAYNPIRHPKRVAKRARLIDSRLRHMPERR